MAQLSVDLRITRTNAGRDIQIILTNISFAAIELAGATLKVFEKGRKVSDTEVAVSTIVDPGKVKRLNTNLLFREGLFSKQTLHLNVAGESFVFVVGRYYYELLPMNLFEKMNNRLAHLFMSYGPAMITLTALSAAYCHLLAASHFYPSLLSINVIDKCSRHFTFIFLGFPAALFILFFLFIPKILGLNSRSPDNSDAMGNSDYENESIPESGLIPAVSLPESAAMKIGKVAFTYGVFLNAAILLFAVLAAGNRRRVIDFISGFDTIKVFKNIWLTLSKGNLLLFKTKFPNLNTVAGVAEFLLVFGLPLIPAAIILKNRRLNKAFHGVAAGILLAMAFAQIPTLWKMIQGWLFRH